MTCPTCNGTGIVESVHGDENKYVCQECAGMGEKQPEPKTTQLWDTKEEK